MSKELEIRRQFLDEAQEYVAALDAAVLGLAHGRVDGHRINAALRAAHSIKGGAGMMGFHELAQLAHRLEDSFKVLKTQQDLEIDADLETLLLSGIHCLRTTIQTHQQDQTVDATWSEQHVEPILRSLYERLGDPPDEDAVSVLSTDSGQDVIALLFETEVEGCLQRLETVLADPMHPCLREELAILAQELGGLGEMLQLSRFSQLCTAIEQVISQTPTEILPVAQAALDTWRRSQTLVLAGQLEALPTQLPDLPAALTTLVPTTLELQPPGAPAIGLETEPALPPTAATVWVEAVDSAPAIASEIAPDIAVGSPPEVQSDVQYELKSAPQCAVPEEDLHATVRVSVRQLNELNNLFGELTIERNSLDLYLKRLRTLTQLLTQRLRSLDQTNTQLDSAFDRSFAQTTPVPLPLLRQAADPETAARLEPQKFDVLELDQYNELHLITKQIAETIVQVQEVATDIDLSLVDSEQTTRELNKTAKQLQTNLTQIRMRPLTDIVDRFPRSLREWCLQQGKQATLALKGGNTLIERSILEALNDPLMHLLRNAFDHGIEAPETRLSQGKPDSGTIEITATHRGNRTLITLSDDGAGIDLDKIRTKATQMGLDATLLATASETDLLSLIFEPGFSTRDQVTDLSGRGVGLDIVRDSLRQIRGEISVATQPQGGTTFTLSVPFTLSVVRVLLAESNGLLLAFPTDAIQETLLLANHPLTGDRLTWQSQSIKHINLADWLTFHCSRQPMSLETTPSIDAPTGLVILQGGQAIALQVDRTWGEQEVTIRRTEGNLPMPEGFVGCAIVADGRVVPLVNVTDLLEWIISCEQDAQRHAALSVPLPPPLLQLGRPALPAPPPEAPTAPTILVVDDSINIRRFLTLTLERAGFRVEQAKDGLDALDKLHRGIPVQAVICDIEMPRLDGFGFLSKFKATPALQAIPVTMLTSRTGDKHRQLAFSLGASAYFAKPYNEQELLQALRNLLTTDAILQR